MFELRKKIYEDINQIQHAYTIILAAEQLKEEHKGINKWFWHPEQTSSSEYTDLTGFKNNKVILHAEITTSADPKGTIDKKMTNTMANLNNKKGLKYYFVVTSKMKKRAETKKINNKFNIEIRLIGI